jgi:hypothetical protein
MIPRLVRVCAAACAAVVGVTAGAGAQDPADWSRPTEPFRIVGNVYWVGTHDLSSYLITSLEGHIVINTSADRARHADGFSSGVVGDGLLTPWGDPRVGPYSSTI